MREIQEIKLLRVVIARLRLQSFQYNQHQKQSHRRNRQVVVTKDELSPVLGKSTPANESAEYKFDESDQRQIDFMNAEALKFAHQRDKSLLEENETDRAMCAQLMLLATVSFTGTVVLLGNGNIVASFSNAQKMLVCIAISLLVISMFAGIRYYKILIRFHKKWADGNQAVANKFATWDFENLRSIAPTVNDILQAIPTETPNDWSKWQERALWISLGVYLLLLVAVLFDFRSSTSQWPAFMR